MNSMIDVSIIVPVMNESLCVEDLANEVTAAFKNSKFSWECIWVDDGSSDDTVKVLTTLAKKTPQHRVIEHERNFGQSAALHTGFVHSRGKVLATLDGDGQNDPADLPEMVQDVIDNKADMMNGIRRKRKDNFIRKMSSKIANGFRNILTGEKVTDVGCAIRAFRRECVDNIILFKGMHRFFPTLVRLQGFTIAERSVNHRLREKGETKYGINNRLWCGIADVFAVCWMKSRLVFPKAKQENPK